MLNNRCRYHQFKLYKLNSAKPTYIGLQQMLRTAFAACMGQWEFLEMCSSGKSKAVCFVATYATIFMFCVSHIQSFCSSVSKTFIGFSGESHGENYWNCQ